MPLKISVKADSRLIEDLPNGTVFTDRDGDLMVVAQDADANRWYIRLCPKSPHGLPGITVFEEKALEDSYDGETGTVHGVLRFEV